MARVHLLATGGTIASRRTDGGLSATTPAAELLAAAGPLPGLEVTVSDLTTVPSFALTGADVRSMVREVHRHLADGADGVVVTHGTDTMEESAFLADLVHGDPRPVRLADVADKHAIPGRFLVQILLQLKNAGLVASTRGAAGGYQLARPPARLPGGGYRLDGVLTAGGLDLPRLLGGSGGTLGVVTAVTLRVVPRGQPDRITTRSPCVP